MPNHHSPHPSEFRTEAVRLVREGGRTPRQLAQDLGCSDETIRNRVRLTTAEREELAQLRREHRVLRAEREILRKAAAFFAKEAAR